MLIQVIMCDQYRCLFFGKTQTCINLYFGEASANLAKFLYDKAGIHVELYKTDFFLQPDDFAYLVNIHATTYDSDTTFTFEHVKHMTCTLLDAYDIMKQRGFGDVNGKKETEMRQATERMFSHTLFYSNMDRMFYNIDEQVAIFVRADELPICTDTMLTINGWEIVASYEPSTINQEVEDKLCELFHGKTFEFNVLYNKLSKFKEVITM